MVVVRMEEHGALEVATDLEELGLRSEAGRVVMEEVHKYLMEASRVQFQYGGRRGPNKWPSQSTNTRRKKRSQGERTKLMFQSEDTYRSLTDSW
jgi:hypothetical protein